MMSLYIFLECTYYFSTQILIVSIDPLPDVTEHLTLILVLSLPKLK